MDNTTIEELNAEEAKQYVGGVVFVTILMVIGIIGNLHVIFVYAFKMKPSNHRIFILVLGVIDLITCSIGMPFIIVDLRNPLTFTMVFACKVLRFINYYVAASSSMILLVIVVERYRKICLPHGKQISQKAAKHHCLVVFGVALLLSWPAPVLYGGSSVHIANYNMTGTRCYTEDTFKDTNYQAYFNAVLILVVFGVFIGLVVLYSLIGRVILKHSNFNVKNKATRAGESSVSGKTFGKEETPAAPKIHFSMKTVDKPSTSLAENISNEPPRAETTELSEVTSANDKQRKAESKFNKMRKTTYMLFMITLVFFLSYIPHLILKIVTFGNKDFVPNMSFAGKVFYNKFIWCFFINNVANSIIYGFCDVRFRQEVFGIYRRQCTRTSMTSEFQ